MVLSNVDVRRYLAQEKIEISLDWVPEGQSSKTAAAPASICPRTLRRTKAIEGLMNSAIAPAGEPFIPQPREFVPAIAPGWTGKTTLGSFTFEQLSTTSPYRKKASRQYVGQPLTKG